MKIQSNNPAHYGKVIVLPKVGETKVSDKGIINVDEEVAGWLLDGTEWFDPNASIEEEVETEETTESESISETDSNEEVETEETTESESISETDSNEEVETSIEKDDKEKAKELLEQLDIEDLQSVAKKFKLKSKDYKNFLDKKSVMIAFILKKISEEDIKNLIS